ncbi:MAG TPA: 16S rRNA (guanine(527)-N(7))-methyltransferase RsmG [Allocoleopsis sp.]
MKEIESNLCLPLLQEVWQQTLNWQPDPVQQASFQQLYQQILQANQALNLTRITAPQEFWEKHLWDSLRGILPWLSGETQESKETEESGSHLQSDQGEVSEPEAEKPAIAPSSFHVIDIGTGAGFPGVPVAIVQPTWQITLMDSTRKKTAFLDTLIHDIALQNATTLTDRAEQIGKTAPHRGHYDLALIRAVAGASVCAEYALPLLKVGGVAVLYRGQWTDEEATSLRRASHLLGGKLESVEDCATPLTQGVRHCIYLRKVKPTPATYPRPAGVPTHKPL